MKLPFQISFKFVFRLLLPGFVAALGVLPALLAVLSALHVPANLEVVLVIASLGFGWLFVVLDMPIYMAAEGRRYWLPPLRRIGLRWEQQRAERLWADLEAAHAKQDRPREQEIAEKMQHCPLTPDGKPEARYPTRMGNLLASYETYPLRAHGLSGRFYWARLWLLLDEDCREELDNRQALVDSTLYTAVALKLNALAALIYALLAVLGLHWIPSLPDWPILLALALCAMIAAFALYRASLHLHAQYGETFKALFDVHRAKLHPWVDEVMAEITRVTGDSTWAERPYRERYGIVAMYLEYHRVPTPEGKFVSVAEYTQ